MVRLYLFYKILFTIVVFFPSALALSVIKQYSETARTEDNETKNYFTTR